VSRGRIEPLYTRETCLWALDDAYLEYGGRFSRDRYERYRTLRFQTYRARTMPSQRTIRRRFGSWAAALDAVEIYHRELGKAKPERTDEPRRGRQRWSWGDCYDAIKAALRLTGRTTITVAEYSRLRGSKPWPSQDTIRRRLGGWTAAIDTVMARHREAAAAAEQDAKAYVQHMARRRLREAKQRPLYRMKMR
jgi:hypothetical protein